MFFKKNRKAQSVEEASASKESQGTVLTGDQFCYLNLRHWSDIDERDLSSLHFGSLNIVDATPISVTESTKDVGLIEFDVLQRYSLAVGICRKAHFQFKVFGYNYDYLLDSFNFDENGVVSFKHSSLTEEYVKVNALWQNMVTSGQKFLHWLETDLEDRFGADSEEFASWRKEFARAADKSLACDFCFRMPKIIEREFLFVNTTNTNLDEGTTAFAISLDQGFMDHDMGESLREKVYAIVNSRLERGLSPQLAVNASAVIFHEQVSLLYAHYLSTMMNDADKAAAMVERLAEDSYNCVIRTVPLVAGEVTRPTKMVYRMPNPSMIEYYQSIATRIRKNLADRA